MNEGNDIAHPDKLNVCVIDVPRKVSRPKVKTAYKPEPVYTDVDEGHFMYPEFDNTVLRLSSWILGKWDEVIEFSKDKDSALFDTIKLDNDISPPVKNPF